MQSSGSVAVVSVWGDEGCDGNGVAVSKQLGDLCYATDVFLAVLLAEAEIFVEAEPDVVSIKTIGSNATFGEEIVLKLDGNSGLAGGGKAGEPDGETTLAS